jgi:hypothetical protein
MCRNRAQLDVARESHALAGHRDKACAVADTHKKLRPKGAILDSRERCHLARVVTGLTVADSKARMAASQGVRYRIVEAIPH